MNDEEENVVHAPETHLSHDDAAALNPSMAAFLKAREGKLRKRTQQFPVPPRDVWNDDLVVEMVPIHIKRAGMPNEMFIAQCTRKVLIRLDGELVEMPDGWAGIGRHMAAPAGSTIGQIIRHVCSAGGEEKATDLVLGAFAAQIVEWAAGRVSEVEQDLGE